MIVDFLDKFYPDWTKKIVGYAGDGASVNGVRSKTNTAVKDPKKQNVATILQRTLEERGVQRKLLTSWCGAHRNALVWKDSWKETAMLMKLEVVLKKVPTAPLLPAPSTAVQLRGCRAPVAGAPLPPDMGRAHVAGTPFLLTWAGPMSERAPGTPCALVAG